MNLHHRESITLPHRLLYITTWSLLMRQKARSIITHPQGLVAERCGRCAAKVSKRGHFCRNAAYQVDDLVSYDHDLLI